MFHDFCTKLVTLYGEYQQREGQPLLRGFAQSFDEYKFLTGKLEGLRIAEELARELIREMHEGKNAVKVENPLYENLNH